MSRSLTCLTAAVALSLGVFAAPAFAAGPYPCSNETVKITPISIGGSTYELKATCKGSWNVYYSVFSFYVAISASENGGTDRSCLGDIFTANGNVTDARKHKVECAYEDSHHKVKIELKKN